MLTGWSDIDRMFEAMGLLQGRLDSMFENIDRSYGGTGRLVSAGYPRTNLYDKGEHFELKAEVPGLGKDDINIRIQGNYLEISGKIEPNVPKGYSVHRSERAAASFSRSLTLPADVDSSKVTANLKNGLLVLTLPKAETAKPRQISIS